MISKDNFIKADYAVQTSPEEIGYSLQQREAMI